MKYLSVILPTLNEAENIVPLTGAILKIPEVKEILVVDDNSADNTVKNLKRRYTGNKRVKVIINNPSLGLTASIQKGIDTASGKYVAWMDADFSHPPELLVPMLREIKQADMVIGSWLCRGGRDARTEVVQKYLSGLVNNLCQLIFGREIHTYTSGYVMARKQVFADFKLAGDYGEYCIDLLIRQARRGKTIREIPFICVSRKAGKTKTAPNISKLLKNGIRYLKTIIKVYKPEPTDLHTQV
jgi:dolichol-phosphate mannosyltransferase